MSRLSLLLAGVTAFGIAVIMALQESRAIVRLRTQTTAANAELSRAENELAVSRAVRDRAVSDAAAAEKQLAEFAAFSAGAAEGGERTREVEVKAWLNRVKQTRAMFSEHPDQQIPEMGLLTENDWLRVCRSVNLNDDEHRRQALAAIRSAAKGLLGPKLAAALTQYIAAHNGAAPTHMLELAPYFSAPVDPAILQRYTVNAEDSGADLSPASIEHRFRRALQETAAIDTDYDTRTLINSNGSFGFMTAPSAWVENFEDLRVRAVQAYALANHGAYSLKLADIIPYMTPPLPPATVEKLLAAEQKQGR